MRDADINNDPEYVKVYSLPLCFAKIFRNCSYLEYATHGKLPDPPVNGYQAGRGDIGDVCCPCIMPELEGDNDEGDYDAEAFSVAEVEG